DLPLPANNPRRARAVDDELVAERGIFSHITISPPNAPLIGPTPISNIASNSSAPISANLLQPGVQACSDCGSVNKSHTAWVEAGKTKRPSIFIYPFIAAHYLSPEFACTRFRYVKCRAMSNIHLEYRTS